MTSGMISWEGVMRLVEDKLAEYDSTVQATAKQILLERLEFQVTRGAEKKSPEGVKHFVGGWVS